MLEQVNLTADKLVVWYDLPQSSSFQERSIMSLAAAEGAVAPANASASSSP